jgi:hypothetical protein
MTAPLRTLPATVRATQDIWTEEDTGQLFPTAAMRLWDHHLHTGGLLPRAFVGGIYEHDWVCTYHSIACFPHEALIELILEDGSNAESHVWVERVGPSTLYLSQMLTLYDEVLATSVRMLSRKAKGVPVPFTEVERYHFENECAADQMILDLKVKIAEKFPGDDDESARRPTEASGNSQAHFPAWNSVSLTDGKESSNELEKENNEANSSSELRREAPSIKGSTGLDPRSPRGSPLKKIINQKNPKKRKMTLANTLSLESFGTLIPQYHGSFLLAVRVGPQHLDTITHSNRGGKFADTAWLADVAFQALCSAELIDVPSSEPGHHTNMAICYRSVAMLGNELRCILHSDRVIMIRSAIPALGEQKGNQTVVLIAKAGPVPAS